MYKGTENVYKGTEIFTKELKIFTKNWKYLQVNSMVSFPRALQCAVHPHNCGDDQHQNLQLKPPE